MPTSRPEDDAPVLTISAERAKDRAGSTVTRPNRRARRTGATASTRPPTPLIADATKSGQLAPVTPSWSDRTTSPSFYERRGKRLLDVVLSLLLLLVLSPVIVTVAISVLVCMGRPVVFAQKRVGRGNVMFTIYKFRSMSSPGTTSRTTYGVDARGRAVHTRLGRVIRKTSLDELPQLFNVLGGTMSLVGPRPELQHIAADGGYLHHPRHQARPGITGPFQVSTLRGSKSLVAGLHLDVSYVENVSLKGDLRILARTVRAMGRGA